MLRKTILGKEINNQIEESKEMSIEKIIEMVEEIKGITSSLTERKKLLNDFIKNFKNEYIIVER